MKKKSKIFSIRLTNSLMNCLQLNVMIVAKFIQQRSILAECLPSFDFSIFYKCVIVLKPIFALFRHLYHFSTFY